MTDLSIVIPAQNKFEAFERTLLSVLERSPKRCEIIVVVDNAYADPYDLDGEVRFVRVDDGATLASSLNAGLIASRGEFVHVLAAGATATDDWAQNALRRFENSQVAAVASRIVYADDPVHVHSAGIHYCRGGGLKFIGHGDATEHCMSLLETIDSPHALAGFYRRTALGQLRELFCTRLGGLSSTVDLGLRLKRIGYHVEAEINSVVQAGRDELIEPSIGYAGGIEAERLFWRNLSRHGMARSLAEHTVVNAIELVHAIAAPRRAARVLGRLAGWCEYPSHLRHWHELAQEAHYGPAPDDDCTSAIPPPLGLVRYRLNQPARSLADA